MGGCERIGMSLLASSLLNNLKMLGMLGVVVACLSIAGLASIGASTAGADATIAPSSIVGSAGLPDGRVYEQASPTDKNGNVAGYELVGNGERSIGAAAASGEAVEFEASGPIGETPSGFPGASMYVARHARYGWTTSAAVPRQAAPIPGNLEFGPSTVSLVPSSNFSSFAFTAYHQIVAEEPAEPASSLGIFLSRNPFEAPTWIGKLENTAYAVPQPGYNNSSAQDYFVMGGTPDLSTLYFTYSGTLLEQDQSRVANVGDGTSRSATDPWGFYEWHDGKLGEAGVLPNGELSPFGAVAAAIAGESNNARQSPGRGALFQPQALDNEVSSDGTRAFFVSPDPVAGSSAGPPQLYVREHVADGSARTVLVSRDLLLPPVAGLPAGAPDGAVAIANPTFIERANRLPDGRSFVFASPDGSQAFFASTDRLTDNAPNDSSLKEYDFNVDTEELTYLPGIAGGPIVTSAPDGSRFISLGAGQIDLWSSGPGGGQITSIASSNGLNEIVGGVTVYLNEIVGRAAVNGSAFAFRTNAAIPGFTNNGGYEQIYHYDVATGSLACVSCPPTGVIPSGDANLSYNDEGGSGSSPISSVDTRGLSADGDQVFFDTPDPLVPQDTNGKRDVYEWENGHIYLVSSGKSVEDSTFLDSSASGEDVFFVTADGLVSGDVDGAYDVYDARVPRPADSPPASAAPCEGDVCQGPPSVPAPLGAPASAAFFGLGNQVSSPPAKTVIKKTVKHNTRPKKRKKKQKHKSKAKKSGGRQHGGKI